MSVLPGTKKRFMKLHLQCLKQWLEGNKELFFEYLSLCVTFGEAGIPFGCRQSLQGAHRQSVLCSSWRKRLPEAGAARFISGEPLVGSRSPLPSRKPCKSRLSSFFLESEYDTLSLNSGFLHKNCTNDDFKGPANAYFISVCRFLL